MVKWLHFQHCFFCACLILGLAGCTRHYPGEPHDPSVSLSRDQFLDLINPPATLPLEEMDGTSPPMLELLEPVAPADSLEPLITVRATGGASLSSLFETIAQQAEMDLLLEKGLQDAVHYVATDRSLSRVLDDIATTHRLRIQLEEGLLKVGRDRPYLKTYDISFLTLVRESDSSIGVNTSMLGMAETAGGKNSNGSYSYLSGKSHSNFWEDLGENIAHILDLTASPEESHGASPMSNGRSPEEGSVRGQGTKASTKPLSRGRTGKQGCHYTINKQAGFISVRAKDAQHKEIGALIARIKKSLSSQILIEAKVVEIKLKDEYRSGINWQSAFKGAVNFDANLASISNRSMMGGMTTPQDALALSVNGEGLSSILNLMESFGTVRTLSSPRLTVMNNQTALLKVADNLVFFRVKYDRQYYTDGANQRVNNVVAQSSIETVPVGFIMSVHPAIDHESGDIILTLRPTITRVMGRRTDPAVQLMAKRDGVEVQSEVPIIAVREMDSVLRIGSGQVAILGGLMQESSENVEAGLPGLKETPLNFFTQAKSDDRGVVELVIFIKATIVKDQPLSPADQRLYKNYFKDPRPL